MHRGVRRHANGQSGIKRERDIGQAELLFEALLQTRRTSDLALVYNELGTGAGVAGRNSEQAHAQRGTKAGTVSGHVSRLVAGKSVRTCRTNDAQCKPANAVATTRIASRNTCGRPDSKMNERHHSTLDPGSHKRSRVDCPSIANDRRISKQLLDVLRRPQATQCVGIDL
jgi:hypothetical protein